MLSSLNYQLQERLGQAENILSLKTCLEYPGSIIDQVMNQIGQ